MPPHLRLASDSAQCANVTFVGLPIGVIVADDHTLLRRSLRLLLEHERDFEVLAEAGDLTSAKRHVDRMRPAVLVLDLRMPDGSSVELIGELRGCVSETQIVVVTMERDPGFARRALDAGALGFVLKDLADTELPAAVRAAAHGQEYVSPGVAAHLDRAPSQSIEDKRSRT